MTFYKWPLLLLAMSLVTVPILEARKSAEEEKIEDLNDLSKRLNRLASKAGETEDQRLLHTWVSELMSRARKAPAGSYVFDRLESAIDALLDASDEVESIRYPDDDEDEEDRESNAKQRTARELERAYFRVKQGDYFAKQSGNRSAGEYVRLARRFYQLGRSTYDSGKYWRARRYADAAREVIGTVEDLAQAAVRVPDLPKL